MALAPLARESREQEEAGGRVGKVRDGRNGGAEYRREHMFDKVVTPSDVGKLNRLVVPKHFAERYFPAARGNPTGTVLCFEDAGGEDAGRVWRFRYSYWSSSQSYVMTKGWSGFVRDKRLAAGDTVSFCRGAGARLFIDCRRRHQAPAPAAQPDVPSLLQAPAARGRCLRLFGVDLETGVDRPLPVLLDLQLALRR